MQILEKKANLQDLSELRSEINFLKVITVSVKKCKNASSKKEKSNITSFMEVS